MCLHIFKTYSLTCPYFTSYNQYHEHSKGEDIKMVKLAECGCSCKTRDGHCPVLNLYLTYSTRRLKLTQFTFSLSLPFLYFSLVLSMLFSLYLPNLSPFLLSNHFSFLHLSISLFFPSSLHCFSVSLCCFSFTPLFLFSFYCVPGSASNNLS